MTGPVSVWCLGDQRSHPAHLVKVWWRGRESSTYLVWGKEKALPMRAKACTQFNIGCVKWRDMGDTKDKHQPGAANSLLLTSCFDD